MGMNLSAPEIRVLGCLLEKQRTTPDQYPLTLNALRLACNQSTNREPVVDYDGGVLRDALHRLERRGYTRLASGAGSRAPKYRHLLAEALPMADDEQAVMCVLMLRGAQTPGELKQRAERMHAFADLGSVHATFERLIGRELVACLVRRPGQKEDRYVQLLEDADAGALAADRAGAIERARLPSAAPASSGASEGPAVAHDRFVDPAESAAFRELEERVARLERELQELRGARRESSEPVEHGAGKADETPGDPYEPPARDPEHAGSWSARPNGFSES
jgi:uncharacterized protein YceH (UPF0502 family)